jgi:hypothetical protein
MWIPNQIPKIAHFYWGEKTLPWLRFLTLSTFQKFNPDWEIRYYVPKERSLCKSWVSFEQKYDITGKDYTPHLKQMGISIIALDFKSSYNVSNNVSEVHKSDYLRWGLLSTVGGLWSDMDIIYFNSMDKVEIKSDINTIVCNNVYGNSIGFMMGSPNNPYYNHLKKKTLLNFTPDNYQTWGSLLVNKEFPSPETISQKYKECKVFNLPMDVVYAYNANMLEVIYNTNNMNHYTKNSIGLHWYAGYPVAEKLINELNEENFVSYAPSIITETIKKALL